MLNNLSPNQHMLSCPALSSWDHKMWRSAPCWWRCALQEAATQSEAVSPEAPRRSCSWTGAASRETPRGTPAATRVTRTWRTVMTAWVACEHCPAPLPHPSLEKRLVWSSVLSRCSSIPSRQNFSFPCSPGQTLLSSHLLPGALFLFSPPSIFFFKSFSHLFLHHRTKLSLFCPLSAFESIACLSSQANWDNTHTVICYHGTRKLTRLVLNWAVTSKDFYSHTLSQTICGAACRSTHK